MVYLLDCNYVKWYSSAKVSIVKMMDIMRNVAQYNLPKMSYTLFTEPTYHRKNLYPYDI